MKTFRTACDPWGITVERVEVGQNITKDYHDNDDFVGQVKNLSVARDMVRSLAVEAQASREANGLLIMQKGEGRSLAKIK